MQQLTVEQAIAYNKGLIPTARQSTLQIKNWYNKGYCLCEDKRWYYFSAVSGKYYPKYYTGE